MDFGRAITDALWAVFLIGIFVAVVGILVLGGGTWAFFHFIWPHLAWV